MTTQAYLDRWRVRDVITPEQHAVLTAIVAGTRFSVFLEVNALLYLGVAAFVAGLGWTIRDHFASLGDAAVIGTLVVLFAACLYYCFSRAEPYTTSYSEARAFGFDYVLYLGCLVFAVGLGYVEFRFELLKERWDWYLLLSALMYGVLAYRFDNRFVLSLSLSTLAGWFGVRFSMHGLSLTGSTRVDALAYGGAVAACGLWLHRARIKSHFLETYLHVAANAAMAAMMSGVATGERRWLWLLGLLAASAVSIERGARLGHFAFVAYGVVYGYLGVTIQILRQIHDGTAWFLYLIVSGGLVVVSLTILSRRLGREE
jgi:hypothetical protein